MSAFSQPYGATPKAPAWGAPTARANFCEEDYAITSLIAEFVNTLTNVVYVIYGIHGLRRLQLRNGSQGPYSSFALPYWGLIGVGVCSACFHASLEYHAQMSDDISMLVATAMVLHRILTYNSDSAYRRNVFIALMGTLVPFSIYHYVTNELVGHVAVFAGMILYIGYKTRELIARRIKTREARRRVRKLERTGAFCAIFGYALWNIDMHLCDRLTAFKHALGLPLGMLFELHGWWHVLTAISAYVFMALTEYLTSPLPGDTIEKDFAWPVAEFLEDLTGLGEEERRRKVE